MSIVPGTWEIFLFTFASGAAFYAVPFLCPKGWSKDSRNRLVATVHAVVSSILGMIALAQFRDKLFDGTAWIWTGYTDISTIACSISTGYFLSDCVVGFLNPGILDKFMWIHHIFILFSFIGCLSFGAGIPLSACFLINEISTPYTHIHGVFLKDTNGAMKALNGLGMWLSFLVFRVILNSILAASIVDGLSGTDGPAAFSKFPVLIPADILVMGISQTLNLIWFWRITRGLVKAVKAALGFSSPVDKAASPAPGGSAFAASAASDVQVIVSGRPGDEMELESGAAARERRIASVAGSPAEYDKHRVRVNSAAPDTRPLLG